MWVEMPEPSLKASTEVEAVLRDARNRAAERVTYISELGIDAAEEWHHAVLADLDQVIADYVNRAVPPEEKTAEPEPEEKSVKPGFPIGSRVRLTGEEWDERWHGARAGDIVTVTGSGDSDVDYEATFTADNGDVWYVYTRDSEYHEAWGGDLVDEEIRVGDTVRITSSYADLLPGFDRNVGEEFVVTGRVEDPESPVIDGKKCRFYVRGDKSGRGVWDRYIEKVYA